MCKICVKVLWSYVSKLRHQVFYFKIILTCFFCFTLRIQICSKNPGFPQTNPMTWGWDKSTINPTSKSGGVWIPRVTVLRLVLSTLFLSNICQVQVILFPRDLLLLDPRIVGDHVLKCPWKGHVNQPYVSKHQMGLEVVGPPKNPTQKTFELPGMTGRLGKELPALRATLFQKVSSTPVLLHHQSLKANM